MRVSVFIKYYFRLTTKIDLEFEFFKKSGGLVLYIWNCFFKPIVEKCNSVENPFQNSIQNPFLIKKNQEAQYQFADNFNSNNFNFTICTPWFNKLWQSDLKLTSETALGSLLKG